MNNLNKKEAHTKTLSLNNPSASPLRRRPTLALAMLLPVSMATSACNSGSNTDTSETSSTTEAETSTSETTIPTTTQGPTTTSSTGSSTTESTSTDTTSTSDPTSTGPTTTDDTSSSTAAMAECGNGELEPDEECDDGNAVDDDGCTNACTLPQCGDGVVQLDTEECDDGNAEAGDGCDEECSLEALYVFVTSAAYNGAMGGLAGADELCNTHAQDAGLTGEFMAWLSAGDTGPADRFPTKSMDKPYVRTDGVVVADDWTQLSSGTLQAGIDKDEHGDTAPALGPNSCAQNAPMVWSNTASDGTPIAEAHSCVGWQVSLGNGPTPPRLGTPGATDETWSDWCSLEGQNACLQELSLYCVEQ